MVKKFNIINNKFICDLCDKNYTSYQSIWNHFKKFHPDNLEEPIKKPLEILPNPPELLKKPLELLKNTPDSLNVNNHTCEYCKRVFTRKDNLVRHINNKCKKKDLIINEYEILKKENIELKEQIQKQTNNMQLEMDELRKQLLDLMNKNCKVHHKTYKRIKNQTNIQNQTNGNVIGTINNYIVNLGSEKVNELLSAQDKLNILQHKGQAIYKCIEYVHFNDKYPQWKNVVIQNNRTNEALLFDTELNCFKLVSKEELINDIIEYRTCDIEDFLEEFRDKLDDHNINIIEKYLEDRGESSYIRDKVKNLIYNNRHKVNIKAKNELIK